MALTRAQLIQGDSSQGTILSNTVQGVKGGGAGVAIANDGTISFVAATSTGVVKLNNGSGYNGYVWPSAAGAAGSILYATTPSTLAWTTEFVSAVLPKATAAAVIPAGTNLQRPGSPVAGLLRFNTESLVVEYYTGSGWTEVAATGSGGFASGTRLLFPQAGAPEGWTQSINTYNHSLRLVGPGAGGGGGGSQPFTSVFTTRTGSVGDTTLSVAQMPSHNHYVYTTFPATLPVAGTRYVGDQNLGSSLGDLYSGFAGSGTSHNHPYSLDFSVLYIDLILCTKD